MLRWEPAWQCISWTTVAVLLWTFSGRAYATGQLSYTPTGNVAIQVNNGTLLLQFAYARWSGYFRNSYTINAGTKIPQALSTMSWAPRQDIVLTMGPSSPTTVDRLPFAWSVTDVKQWQNAYEAPNTCPADGNCTCGAGQPYRTLQYNSTLYNCSVSTNVYAASMSLQVNGTQGSGFNASITMDPWTSLGAPSPTPPADYPMNGFATIQRPSNMTNTGNRNNTWRTAYRWCATTDSLAADYAGTEGQPYLK
eukprot:jgi/Botrbrau1/5081/Bobra.37_1s0043.1